MKKEICIGSRDSALAQWQAYEVQKLLLENQTKSKIEWIKSIGDLVQDKPLQNIGTVGVFTKALDDALLDGRIDIAVHSCKDLPSVLHPELTICAYLPREDFSDVIVGNSEINFFDEANFSGTIATGSVRRKAQILAKFPKANVVGLRGNVPTRLQKLKDNGWDGAVFAWAGLKRLQIEPEFYEKANFMVPAPAQGVVAVVCRKADAEVIAACKNISHEPTAITTQIEREFLRLMEGGCISPIGANAVIEGEEIKFTISVLNTNGSKSIQFTEVHPKENWKKIAQAAFVRASAEGATEIIKEIEENQ